MLYLIDFVFGPSLGSIAIQHLAAGLIKALGAAVLLEGATSLEGRLQEETFRNLHAFGGRCETRLGVHNVIVLGTPALVVPLLVEDVHLRGDVGERVDRRPRHRAVGIVVARTGELAVPLVGDVQGGKALVA